MDTTNFNLLACVAVVVCAYLLGSMSFAILVSKAFGLSDPRSYGSKNPGATNVLRSGDKKAAALTLLLDGFKGWLPTYLVTHFGVGLGAGTIALVAMAAFAGHLFPIFFGFKGGKGVATFLGAVLGVQPILGVAALLTWLIVAYFTRYSSLAAMVAAVFVPFYYGFLGQIMWPFSIEILTALLIMGAVLIYRHRGNIQNLLNGSEGKIGAK